MRQRDIYQDSPGIPGCRHCSLADGAYILGQAIANVVNILDPEVIVLGGGVSKAGAFLLDAIREEFRQYVLFNDQPLPGVELAVLGPDAGIIGAAMLS